MPYYISDENPDCAGWAVEKEDGEVIGCHRSRADAIEQMVAVSLAEEIEPGGEREKASGKRRRARRRADVKLAPEDLVPPKGAQEEARRGLAWRREHGRGGTPIGVARARDISNGRSLSVSTVKRMRSYFARHEVDQAGEGWSPGEPGYPSAGRIAWALWGGSDGRRWADSIVRRLEAEDEKAGTPGTGRTEVSTMNTKRINAAASFSVKEAPGQGGAGTVEAVVSVFSNTDLMGEKVMPGAFRESLERYKKSGRSIPFVWNHQFDDADSFLGKIVEAKETSEGLVVKAELFSSPKAQHVRQLLASGVVSEFSFAYDVEDSREGKDGTVELTRLHIYEAGPTLRGANDRTRLIGVRSLGDTPAKAGRVLSAKNEDRLRRAAELLEEVLSTLNTGSTEQAPEQPAKAAPGELEEGSWVTWGEDEIGTVAHVMTEGTLGAEGDPMSLEASEDDPLALVRLYEEAEDGSYEPTDTFAGFRFSDLTAVEAPQVKALDGDVAVALLDLEALSGE